MCGYTDVCPCSPTRIHAPTPIPPHPATTSATLQRDDANAAATKTVDGDEVDVQMRLAPNPYDLAYARNITLQQAGNMTAADGSDLDNAAIKVLVEEKLKALNSSWGTIPVFTMAGMQIMRNDTGIRPWFVSLEDCGTLCYVMTGCARGVRCAVCGAALGSGGASTTRRPRALSPDPGLIHLQWARGSRL